MAIAEHHPSSRQSTLWVLVSTPITGISTYVLLVVTARAVGPDAFGAFGVFWATTVICGLGLFLPLEQETTRRGSGREFASLRALWRRGARVASFAAATCVGLALIAWPWYSSLVDDNVGLLAAFVVAIVGNLMQFPSRGVLASARRFRDYGLVVTVEAVMRALASLVLLALGSESAAPFALSVGFAALISGAVAMALARRTWSLTGGVGIAPVEGFGRDGGRLVLAASAMQTTLNSGTIVAKMLAPAGQAALAGQLMATLTLARLPILVVQSIQATYLSRLAARWHAQDSKALRRLLATLGVGVIVVGIGLVAGAATVGSWAMSTVFGSGYVTDRTTVVLVAAGVAVYLIASVASDAGIAMGLHTAIVIAWLCGLVAAIVMAVAAPTLLTAATLPLVVGALVAALILARPLLRRALGTVD